MSQTVENMVSRAGQRKLLNKRIGRTAKALLKARGMTARQLGSRIQEDETTVSKMFNGSRNWQADDLRDVASALGVEMWVLYEEPTEALRIAGFSTEAVQAMMLNLGVGKDEPGRGGAGDTSPRYQHYVLDLLELEFQCAVDAA